jgi:hypothetical protein
MIGTRWGLAHKLAAGSSKTMDRAYLASIGRIVPEESVDFNIPCDGVSGHNTFPTIALHSLFR